MERAVKQPEGEGASGFNLAGLEVRESKIYADDPIARISTP